MTASDPRTPFVRATGSDAFVLLKDGPRRRVHLERDAQGRGVVVKRIALAGISGLRARRLGRREFAVQRQLFARGLAVPEPLELRESPGAIEWTQRWIEGARELADLLRDARGASGRSGSNTTRRESEIARDLGRLLAAAHAVGLDHPDLHEKNILVGGDGGVRLIDFHGATLLRAPDAAVARRDLVQIAAATRESTSVRSRQRALIAWWRAVDPRARPDRSLAEFAAEIEDAARSRRRAVLSRATKRWERPSSSSRAFALPHASGDRRGMARAEFDDELVAAMLDRAWNELDFEFDAPCGGLGPEFSGGVRVLVQVGGDPKRTRAAFLACARLADHALDVARPLVHLHRPEPVALFGLPRSCRPMESHSSAVSSAARLAHARAFGTLFGSFADRGLALELRSSGSLHVSDDGRVWLAPPFAVHDDRIDRLAALEEAGEAGPPRGTSMTRGSALAVLVGDDREARRAWWDGWRSAQRGGTALDLRIGARIEAEVARG